MVRWIVIDVLFVCLISLGKGGGEGRRVAVWMDQDGGEWGVFGGVVRGRRRTGRCPNYERREEEEGMEGIRKEMKLSRSPENEEEEKKGNNGGREGCLWCLG